MTDPLPMMLRPLSQDQRVVLERHWQGKTRGKVPQKPMDVGLFSSDHLQAEMLDMGMFQDPQNDE